MLNALSCDFEEWFHPELVQPWLRSAREPRAGAVVRELLGALDRHGHRCTFFVLSDTVRAYPDLMCELAARGHEIGMHGHTHSRLEQHTRDSFRRDIEAFLATLKHAGVRDRPKGYRAPTFSLSQQTSWAIDVLAEQGFVYSSSIFPVKNHLYGVAGAPLSIYRPDPSDVRRGREHGLVEFPMSVARFGGVNIPVSGGFYFRVAPFFVTRRLLAEINREERPFVFYFHPWEMDPGIPRLELGVLDRLITYFGISSMKAKLDRLFETFQLGRIDTVLGLEH